MNTLENVRKAPSNKTMGIEIEMCVRHGVMDDKDYHGFFYRGYDGSISAPYDFRGCEWVSQPLTVSWLKREITKLYTKLDGEYSVNRSCGIHIHVSRKWCSEKKAREIYDIIKFFHSEELEDIFGRSLNGYTDGSYGNRYCMVNNTNDHTIEFRMFAPGNEAWALYCVDLAQYLVQNAHHLSTDGIRAFRDMYPKVKAYGVY
jgi:hypothetical protein